MNMTPLVIVTLSHVQELFTEFVSWHNCVVNLQGSVRSDSQVTNLRSACASPTVAVQDFDFNLSRGRKRVALRESPEPVANSNAELRTAVSVFKALFQVT